ncbi:hypothetical protein OKW96_20450 [Sphingobacterium sp. KU25419]|nr:hypothetical protein OKW96_20450 [Sphingobacterium sp. KU25419]
MERSLYALGEDLLTTSYFAYRDVQSQKKRGYFSWKSTITTDNKRLRQLLQSGVSENHAHYGASGPTFELSWIVLMNRYNEPFVKKGISDLIQEGRLSPKLNKGYNKEDINLSEMIKEAIILRFELLRHNKKRETGKEIFITPSYQGSPIDSRSGEFYRYDTTIF